MRFGGLAVGATVWTFVSWVLFAGCGARTDLDPFPEGERDAGRDSGDASRDARPDAPPDAPPDSPPPPPDASIDATPDADAELPPGCDAGDDKIVLLTASGELFTFDPTTFASVRLGQLGCATDFNSMTVSRTGRLYLSSGAGELYIADLDTLACEKTPFDASQVNSVRYGMGFTADDVPAGETLFIAARRSFEEVDRLARIDLDDYELHDVGYYSPPLPPAEVKGTSDGRLFLIHVGTEAQAARLIEVDKHTGALGYSVELPVGVGVYAFDFAYWGGAFYIFLSQDNVTATVIRYTPDVAYEVLGEIPVVVVGAGVSTCAPL